MMDLKMEVYTPSLELIGFLEIHRSVIWEDKAFSEGSFSVESLITPESLAMLQPENIIWIEGETAGIIEYVQEEAGESGPYITVKGRTLTGILDRRILWGLYNLKGTVPQIMNALVDDCCINPTRDDVEARKIPGLVLMDAPAGGDAIQLQATGGTLLERLETLGETYGVAFGVRFNAAVPQMEFWTRWGQNRSIHQSNNNHVLYSTELDDVLSSEYLYNSQDYRNVALVAGEGEGNDRKMVSVENEVVDPDAPVPPTPPGPTPVTKYTVTLLVNPEGGGTVSGGKTVAAGVSVTVTAAPSDGYTFSGWQENGVIVSKDRSYTFKVDRDRTLTAVFAVIVRAVVVTVNIDPPGGGSVVGSGSYEQGQLVTLTQTPGSIYRFSGWYSSTGQQLETGDKYTFTASEDVEITAKYAELAMYSISATVDPGGAGTVTGTGQHRDGAIATVRATPGDGYTFSAWKENGTTVSSSDAYTFTVNGNRSLTAVFAAVVPVYSIKATVDPTGSGAVVGTGQYNKGKTVNLKAAANAGYTFSDWKEGGATVHNAPDYSFTAEKDRNLVAAFEVKPSSRLPDGYTEVEYIQSIGNQHIDTGVAPGEKTKIVIDIEPTSAGNGYAFGSLYTSGSGTSAKYYRFSLYFGSSNIVRFMCGVSSAKDFSSTYTQRKTATLASASNSYTCSYGDLTETVSAVITTGLNPKIALLSNRENGTFSNKLSAKLYSCQMYDGDTPIRDFVPCINPSKQVGLYDLANGAFYGNAGTGAFAAGPAI